MKRSPGCRVCRAGLVVCLLAAAAGGIYLWKFRPAWSVFEVPNGYAGREAEFRDQIVPTAIEYDVRGHVLTVKPWIDPSGKVIPSPGSGAVDLAPLTFRVRDPQHVSIVIAGKVHPTVVRRGTGSGRGTVTIVDDSDPVTLFEEIDPYQKRASEICTDADSYFRSADAYHGACCLEMVLTKPTGNVAWTFPPRSVGDCRYFRFAYRKSRPDVRVAISLQKPDGSTWTVAEEGILKDVGDRIAHRSDDEWHEVVIDLEGFLNCGAGMECTGLTISATGEPGDAVYYDSLQFLRQSTTPATNGRVTLRGITEPAEDGRHVVLVTKDGERSATTAGGRFEFDGAAPPGEAAMIYCVARDGAKRFPTSGRLIEVDSKPDELVIPLADARDQNAGRAMKRSHVMSQYFDADLGILYQPKSMFDHGGIGEPQEFQNRFQVGNLGFLDRDRRAENPGNVPRILLLGACDLFGHSVPKYEHTGAALEGMLRVRTGQRYEVITLADMNANFGRNWGYYDKLGRTFRPQVAVMTICNGAALVESDPDLLCRCYEYDPTHVPYFMFRSRPDDTLEIVPGDPEWPQFTGKDAALKAVRDAERKTGKHRYYMDGIDWVAAMHRVDDDLPPRVQQAFAHLERIVTFYRDQLKKDGVDLIIAIQPLLGMQHYAGLNDWTDDKGVRYAKGRFAERIRAMLKRLNVQYVDVPDYAARTYADPGMYFWRHDWHPSAYGMDWLAEALMEALPAQKQGRAVHKGT